MSSIKGMSWEKLDWGSPETHNSQVPTTVRGYKRTSNKTTLTIGTCAVPLITWTSAGDVSNPAGSPDSNGSKITVDSEKDAEQVFGTIFISPQRMRQALSPLTLSRPGTSWWWAETLAWWHFVAPAQQARGLLTLGWENNVAPCCPESSWYMLNKLIPQQGFRVWYAAGCSLLNLFL